MNDQDRYQSKIKQKCPRCYRQHECICTPQQRAELCLGPFKNEKDRLKKVRKLLQEDKASQKVNYTPEALLRDYLVNKHYSDLKLEEYDDE